MNPTLRRAIVLTYTGVACLLWSDRSRADDAGVIEAQSRFNEGLALADAGRNDEARLKFTQAVAILKAPAVLYNLARAEHLTGHALEALEHYELFLTTSVHDPKINDAMRARTKQYVAELAQRVGRLVVEAPGEARVTIDGSTLSAGRFSGLYVLPGKHTVEASFRGQSKVVALDCRPGIEARAAFAFEEAWGPANGAPPPALPERTSWPRAKVVTVSALAAGAVAGVTAFAIFRNRAQGNVDEARSVLGGASCIGVSSAACLQAETLRSDRDTNTAWATVSIIGGAACLAGAGVAMALWPNSRSTHALRTLPSVGSGVVGLSIDSVF